MWSLLGKIFGSGDVVSKGLDLIDDMHTSTEEEINAKSKAKTDLLNAYAPFKLAQRYIALLFTFTYLACFGTVMGFTIHDGGGLDGVKEVIGEFMIGEIMFTIVLFYFGGGAFEGGVDKFKKRLG